jgi:hypothetical protein
VKGIENKHTHLQFAKQSANEYARQTNACVQIFEFIVPM